MDCCYSSEVGRWRYKLRAFILSMANGIEIRDMETPYPYRNAILYPPLQCISKSLNYESNLWKFDDLECN